jgi:hypothetical protein
MMPPPIVYISFIFPLIVASIASYIDYESLPDKTLFPGPWERYIKAPSNKTYITPSRIWKVRGNVTTSGVGIAIGAGGELTVEFDENIAGRLAAVKLSCLLEDELTSFGPGSAFWSSLWEDILSPIWAILSLLGLQAQYLMLPQTARRGIFHWHSISAGRPAASVLI